jgi:hypothetical protein
MKLKHHGNWTLSDAYRMKNWAARQFIVVSNIINGRERCLPTGATASQQWRLEQRRQASQVAQRFTRAAYRIKQSIVIG